MSDVCILRPRIPFLAVALILSMGFVNAAAAQTGTSAPPPAQRTTLVSPGHWTVTPFVGFGFSGDLDSATGALGAAGGYVWNDRVSLEGELNVLPSSEASGLVEVGTNVWTLTGDLLYHFAGRQTVPYGVLGIGFGHASADVNDETVPGTFDTSSTTFVVNFGGGVEHPLTGRVAVRGDLRYFFGGDLVPDYWRFSGGLTVDLGQR